MTSTRVLAIVGPTATGKTALGVACAHVLNGEVVSADSRQVYRGLNLGTGKVTSEEAENVPHHLIDVVDPNERFTAHDFVERGRAAIASIATRGKLPIVVGGTGLYIDALLGRIVLDAPPSNPELRARVSRSNLEHMQDELRRLDPERYARTDLKNRRRVERALEIALTPAVTTAYPLPPTAYSVAWIGLSLSPELLKERIKARLAARLAAGMLDEARTLICQGVTLTRMEELGLEYRYMARHLSGTLSYNAMVSTLETQIYKFAKRQMTWFKRNELITWHDATTVDVADVVKRVRAHQDSNLD